MGKPCFSRIIKFFAIALLGAAAAIAVIAVLSSPATAQAPGGGGGDTEKPWDTDNLRYTQGSTTYTAKNFRVPYHKYGSYATDTTASRRAKNACQGGGIADGFFQTDAAGRNDFPELSRDDDGDWEISATGSKTSGCAAFVDAQLQMAARARTNGGYYLDSAGNLQKAVVASSRFLVAPASRTRTYTSWGTTFTGVDPNLVAHGSYLDGGRTGAQIPVSRYGQVPDAVKPYGLVESAATVGCTNAANRGLARITGDGADYYLARTDNQLADRQGAANSPARVSSPQPSGAWEPSAAALSAENERVIKTAGTYYRQRDGIPIPYTRITWYAVVHFGRCDYQRFLLASQDRGSDSNMSALCPAGMHPRGQDGFWVIGSGTGRTLSSLNGETKVKAADRYWCRSDVRYRLAYTAEEHSGYDPPPGITVADDGDVFFAFGRSGCFYTAMSMSAGECEYAFPVPRCDDSGTARDFSETELGKHTIGAKFSPDSDGSTDCGVPVAPVLATFTADPCVTATLEIYENRIAGGDAEPGVISSDRTLAVAAGRTTFDLDVTSPHPLTASPPRDATAGTGDPDGCADGSESRADHAASSGAAARRQSPAPTYAASGRTDTAAPPNDADGDIDYSGAVRNMAHRYASRVAENTCSVKRSEADAELALLEAREAAFTRWLSDYKTAADSNASRMRSYRRVSYQSGAQLRVLRFNDLEQSKADYAAARAPLYTALSGVLVTAKTNYDTTTDRTTGASRASVIPAASDSGCVAHYTAEITRLKNLFAAAEKTATDAIKPAERAVNAVRIAAVPHIDIPIPSSVRLPDISHTPGRTETVEECPATGTPPNCTRSPRQGETCPQGVCADSPRTRTIQYYTCRGHRGVVDEGAVVGTYKGSARSKSYRGTYTAASRGESTSTSCPGWRFSGSTPSSAVSWVLGSYPSASRLPALSSPAAAEGLRSLNKLAVLGSYHTGHADRGNLEAASADTRNSDASFTATAGTASGPAAVATWQSAYKTAYDNAFTQATGHMSGTAWGSFDWRYETTTLNWGSYQEDGATAFSASTATPRDGTGCDLVRVAADGTVAVEATRLDYETSSYGKGNVYSTRTDAQRTCKIRRTRTPELLLMYAPSVVSGTDTSKTADSRLDSDSAASNAEFFYVDYQPTADAERFKLYDEAEVFAVKASLADRAPVLCYQPGEALVAHVGAKGIDAVHKAVFRNASGFAGGNKTHCYRHPSSAQLGSPPRPAFAFFDDTAHSAMDSVSVVWQQPNPKIVSKLGSTDDLKMMANSVALVANTVAYADATRTSSFYGTYYTFPTDSSTESPSGWDISGHPTLTLTSTFRQHVAQAKDAAAKTPTTHTMVFKFVDCVFGIEDVAFVDNIASPYALLSKDGVVAGWKPEYGDTNHSDYNTPIDEWDYGWKQTYDSDPHSSPTWYYPAFSTYEGALRLDGRQDSNGNPITYGRNTQGGFAHPSYTLENTAADGMGWGIVYEDKVGKQQPVWAIYAPPVPGDYTLQAIEVCGTGNLGAGGANPAATTGIPAARRIGTPATPPPASGAWEEWKTSGWNYQDNPVMLWSVDDDPDREDKWEIKTSDSSANLPRKPHNNLEFATEDSTVAALDVFTDTSNTPPAGQSRLEDQDMILANFEMVTLGELESNPDDTNPGLRERAQKGGITCGYNWWYCFRPAPAGYRLWGKEWMSKRQLCVGFNFRLHRWSTTADDVFVSTLDNTDRNERGIPIRLRLGYIVGGVPRAGEPHPDSYYDIQPPASIC